MSATCRPRTARSIPTPIFRHALGGRRPKAQKAHGRPSPRRSRAPTSSFSPPTRTAEGRGDLLACARGCSRSAASSRASTSSAWSSNAITKQAVTEAMKHPRAIDHRAGRRLSGPARGARLSGRIHACRPCCGASCRALALPAGCNRWRCGWSATRELEIEKFVGARILVAGGEARDPARRRLRGPAWSAPTGRRSSASTSARARKPRISSRRSKGKAAFKVALVESKPSKRNPLPAPSPTSTLQQEASRKARLRAPPIPMRLAQRLYEGHRDRRRGGRTSLLICAPTAWTSPRRRIAAIRQVVGTEIRARATCRTSRAATRPRPRMPREAPRGDPADRRSARQPRGGSPNTSIPRQAKLYELIWIRRGWASQMESAELERTARRHHRQGGRPPRSTCAPTAPW